MVFEFDMKRIIILFAILLLPVFCGLLYEKITKKSVFDWDEDETDTEENIDELIVNKTEELKALNEKIVAELQQAENNYNAKMELLDKNISEQTNKLKSIEEEIAERTKERSVIIEQLKADEEIKNQKDFYRIVLSKDALEDIEKLKGISKSLNNPATLNKFIYKEYIETPFNTMCGRVLGENSTKGGIYKIINLNNQMVYIGQTKAGFKNRWRTHVKNGLECGSDSKINKLYSAMIEEGIENFGFQIVEIVEDSSKLTEKERLYINHYDSKNWGYNSKL